eukprot:SAG22_NODE_16147_length_332_cov_0.652361_1_plen_110_part_11
MMAVAVAAYQQLPAPTPEPPPAEQQLQDLRGFLQGFVDYDSERREVAEEILTCSNDLLVQQIQSSRRFFHCPHAAAGVGWYRDADEHSDECIYCPDLQCSTEESEQQPAE